MWLVMTYVVMTYVFMNYVLTYVVMAHVGMAHIGMACILMACIVMAYIVMASRSTSRRMSGMGCREAFGCRHILLQPSTHLDCLASAQSPL